METTRLRLTPPSLEDQPAMLVAIKESQQELKKFLPWVPFALSQPASIENTQQAIENFAGFKDELRYSLIEKTSGRLIGAIGLIIRDKEVPFFEIGYWLRSDSVGKGFITEAVTRLEEYAFDELKANRIEIRAAQSNVKSRNVAQRCGYELEATLRNERRLPSGKLDNTLVFVKPRN
ncbi:GNAT family N-acetyltransferase [Vibrio breoganii]|uniref:GNAT family N-acetyltransferase n=1 Tax=Vibrio breoganii TaxID=553239 RepID=UPI00080E5F72|nr:GNAT family N-acetyltransferase [Vibrio breoganii]OCH75768.1 acetyltransferase [Vibrio breoganii]